MLPAILDALEFRSNNALHRPVIEALEDELADITVTIAVWNFDAENNGISSERFDLRLGEFLSATAE